MSNICVKSDGWSVMVYLAAFNALIGSTWLEARTNEITLRLDFRIAGVLFCIRVKLLSVPCAAPLVGRGRIVLVARGHRASLCVKRLAAAVLCSVDADGWARLPVPMEGVMIWPLNQMPQLRAGICSPGVRKEGRNVEVVTVLRCWSGAFLWI